jgi:hypothetical protein
MFTQRTPSNFRDSSVIEMESIPAAMRGKSTETVVPSSSRIHVIT